MVFHIMNGINRELLTKHLQVQISHAHPTRFDDHLGRNSMDCQRLFFVPKCSSAKARVVAEDDDTSFDLTPGRVCILSARRPYRFEFPDGFCLAAFHFRVEGPGGCDVLDEDIPFTLLHKNNVALCDDAWDILHLKKPADWLLAEALLREQIALILDSDWTTIQERFERGQKWQLALDILSSAPVLTGQISEIAERMGVSRHHFTRSFQKHFSCSPRTWHRRKLSQRIVDELMSTEHNLSVIAEAYGFSDAFALSRFVSSSTGMSPKAIRKHGLFGN